MALGYISLSKWYLSLFTFVHFAIMQNYILSL
nr:MAG TPA: hypothetical protein [Caudoviricetes sp.]